MQHELGLAIEAALRAGEVIRQVYAQPDFLVQQKDDDQGPLTQADLASNQVIRELLQNHYPADGWLSEESTDSTDRLDRERVWIVDPLDGTREFTLRMPEFSVSIGLSVAGRAALGVVYNPATGELVAGAQGLGCRLNNIPVVTSAHAALNGSRILTSRNEMEKGGFSKWQHRVSMSPLGSVAYKLALVAAGKFEGTFTPNPRSEWDVCAGVACISAAGGRAGDRYGKDYRFNGQKPRCDGVIGSNGHIHDQIVQLLENA